MADKVQVTLKIATTEGAAGDTVEVSPGRAAALARGNAAARVTAGAAAPEAAPDRRADLERRSVDDLRSMAGDAKVEGRSDMNKAQLIDALIKADQGRVAR